MTHLLDVNVLIALIDPAHIGHDAAHRWFAMNGGGEWATCPITENGVIRIIGHPKYPNSPGSPSAVAPLLAGLRSLPGHQFWRDEISLLHSDIIDVTRITTPSQVTDTYLLALAVSRGGRLATFDGRISAVPVRGGRHGLVFIDFKN